MVSERRADGLDRARSRFYEGASTGRRNANWSTLNSGPNVNGLTLDVLRERSRDLTRNNGYAEQAVRVIANNVIVNGIIPLISATDVKSAESQALAERVQEEWETWADTSGFYGLQTEMMRTVVESGSALVIREYLTLPRMRRHGLHLNFRAKILEPDHLDKLKDGTQPDGTTVKQGIHFDKYGDVLGYWLYKDHPRDMFPFRSTLESVYYKAEDVAHVFRSDRPNMVQGVPWCHSIIQKIKKLDEYQDAEVERKITSAAITGIIRKPEPEDGSLPPAEGLENEQFLEPGMLVRLEPGEDVTFPAQMPSSDYAPFTKVEREAVAAGYGIPYFVLTGDISNTSYSSTRAALSDFAQNIKEWRWQIVIHKALKPVFGWFMEALDLTQGIGAERYRLADWSEPYRQSIKPKEDIEAYNMAVRSGLPAQIAMMDLWSIPFERAMQMKKREQEIVDRYGIRLETDMRYFSGAGNAVTEPPAEPEKETESEPSEVTEE